MQHHAARRTARAQRDPTRVGPDAPTLCGGWAPATRRPPRPAGTVGGRGGRSAAVRRVQAPRRAGGGRTAPRPRPYAELVDTFDRGPHWREVSGPVPTAWLWSSRSCASRPTCSSTSCTTRTCAVPSRTGRRARCRSPSRRRPGSGCTCCRGSRCAPVPVGVELALAADGRSATAVPASTGRPSRVTGDPVELAMFAFGRLDVAGVEYEGDRRRHRRGARSRHHPLSQPQDAR